MFIRANREATFKTNPMNRLNTGTLGLPMPWMTPVMDCTKERKITPMEEVCIRSTAKVSSPSVKLGYSMARMGEASTNRPTAQGRPMIRASLSPSRAVSCTPAWSRLALKAEMTGTRLMARAMVSTPGILVRVATLVRMREKAVWAVSLA